MTIIIMPHTSIFSLDTHTSPSSLLTNLEEGEELVFGGQTLKDRERHEKGDSPGAVLVGQCYHHELPPWPNVQEVGRHCKLREEVRAL